MFRNLSIVLLVVVAAAVLVAAARTARAKVDEKTVQRITKAMPDKAPAKPAKPRKVLLYGVCGGFRHGGAIECAKVAFPIMAEKTGAFEVVVSDDLANFEADKLKEFDAIILSNTTGELLKSRGPQKPRKPDLKKVKDPDKLEAAQAKYKEQVAKWQEAVKKFKAQGDPSERLRKNLMDWIKSGKGVVGIHAATDCSYGWKEYGQMMGGYFAGHPWHEMMAIKNDDPTNPINAALEGKALNVVDEIYQFNRGVYSREKQRVLLSLDMNKVKKKGNRKDNDYAISWVKTHGKGRVFYCSLGHRNEIFWNPVVLRHYLAGLQWVLGDLKGVETKPNPLK